MADIVVKYNSVALEPTPFVSQNTNLVNVGGNRWGNILEINLAGNLANISGTGDVQNILLTRFASGQFGTLEVLEGATSIYNWTYCTVDEISVSDNNWFKNSFVPYSVKLRKYNLPSGVSNPVNEYSFSQSEDGTATISHKISAQGVKSSSNGALANAITFVQSLTGRNAYSPILVPNGTGILTSLSENINRAECSYSVNETYKYNTGQNNIYVEWFTANVNDGFEDEYLTVDTDLKIQASPVYKNLSGIETPTLITGADRVYSRLLDIGISTGMLMPNSMSISRDSGAQTVEIKHSFISGYTSGDLSGFFDYNITFDKDVVLPKENWKLDGSFVCKGPLSFKKQKLADFKTASGANWRNTFSGLLTSSPIWTSFHNSTILPSSHSIVTINENTGLGTFNASFTLIEGASPDSVDNPKYSVDISPSKWDYDLMPSSNIEGLYVIQDLQMASKAKMSFNVSCDSDNPGAALPLLSGYISGLEGVYVKNGVVTNENISTGVYDATYVREWIGSDNISTGVLNTKVANSNLLNFTRKPGYLFGY